MSTSEIIALIGMAVTLAGVVWKFASTTSSLSTTLSQLGGAIDDLKSEIKLIGHHSERLAAIDVRVSSNEDRIDELGRRHDRLEERFNDQSQE